VQAIPLSVVIEPSHQFQHWFFDRLRPAHPAPSSSHPAPRSSHPAPRTPHQP
jgi:hypothetical protein